MIQTTIGISTYNGAERLGWLLRSIELRTVFDGNVRVVVVDDGSPRVDATRAIVASYRDKFPLQFIEHGHNRGISAGWNTAARANDSEIVVLANDDVIVSKGWLRGLVHVLQHSPGVGAVGSAIHWMKHEDVGTLLRDVDSDLEVTPRDHNKNHSPERRVLYEDCNPGRVMCPSGQLFAFRRADFDAVGGFDENYKSFFEESCFGTSLAARGQISVGLCWPHCWHLWSETFNTNPELDAGNRMNHSREVYRRKWQVPDSVPRGQEFNYTNPKYMNAIGDIGIEWVRKSGAVERGKLRTDGAYVKDPDQ